jgi:hypothetical protein
LVIVAEPVRGDMMVANSTEAATDSSAHMRASLGHSTTSGTVPKYQD